MLKKEKKERVNATTSELNLEKHSRGIHGKATRAVSLNYGQFGLKATEPERIIGKQIEARVALTRYEKNR